MLLQNFEEKKVTGGSYCRVRLETGLLACCYVRLVRAVPAGEGASSVDGGFRSRANQSHLESCGKKTEEGGFKYDVMWETRDGFSPTLEEAWTKGSQASNVPKIQSKLKKKVTVHLSRWERMSFGSVRIELRELNRELKRKQEDRSRAELKIRVYHRDLASCGSISAGDKNTRFFHLRANQRKRRNRTTQQNLMGSSRRMC